MFGVLDLNWPHVSSLLRCVHSSQARQDASELEGTVLPSAKTQSALRLRRHERNLPAANFGTLAMLVYIPCSMIKGGQAVQSLRGDRAGFMATGVLLGVLPGEQGENLTHPGLELPRWRSHLRRA